MNRRNKTMLSLAIYSSKISSISLILSSWSSLDAVFVRIRSLSFCSSVNIFSSISESLKVLKPLQIFLMSKYLQKITQWVFENYYSIIGTEDSRYSKQLNYWKKLYEWSITLTISTKVIASKRLLRKSVTVDLNSKISWWNVINLSNINKINHLMTLPPPPTTTYIAYSYSSLASININLSVYHMIYYPSGILHC